MIAATCHTAIADALHDTAPGVFMTPWPDTLHYTVSNALCDTLLSNIPHDIMTSWLQCTLSWQRDQCTSSRHHHALHDAVTDVFHDIATDVLDENHDNFAITPFWRTRNISTCVLSEWKSVLRFQSLAVELLNATIMAVPPSSTPPNIGCLAAASLMS